MTNRRRGCGEGRGFTLIELTVVLVIIGIMAGFLIPKLPDITAGRLKSASRRLAATISYLRDRSASSQLVYRLTLDFEKGMYYVSLLNTNNQFEPTELAFAKETHLPDTIRFADVQTVMQGRVSRGQAAIHFFPTGFVEFSVVHLKDNGDNEMTLIVHPLTGKVRILEGYLDVNVEAALRPLRAGVVRMVA